MDPPVQNVAPVKSVVIGNNSGLGYPELSYFYSGNIFVIRYKITFVLKSIHRMSMKTWYLIYHGQ